MRIVDREKRKIKINLEHTNYINQYGEYVPSVTTILKVINKEALLSWANSLGWKRKSVKKELTYASNIGTYVHDTIEKIILNESYDASSIYELETENERISALNALKSFKLWYSKHKDDLEPLYIEKELVCDQFGGTADFIGLYKGKLIILDFKTSGNFYYTMFLQMAAYAYMYEKMTGEEIKDLIVLRLDKKHGEKATTLSLKKDVPQGDINFYTRSFFDVYNLYSTIHVLESDWNEI
jgi:hypothetical protein